MNAQLWTLVQRDLVAQNRTVRGVGVILPLLLLLGYAVDQMELVAPLLLFQLGYGFVMVATHHDERNNSYRWLFTMPVARRDVVTARFVAFAGTAAAAAVALALAQGLFGWGLDVTGSGLDTSRMQPQVVFGALGGLFFLVGLMMPVLFRDGVLGAGLALRVLPLVVIGIALSVEWAMEQVLLQMAPGTAKPLAQWLLAVPGWVASAVLCGGGLFVLGISRIVSVWVLEHKDL